MSALSAHFSLEEMTATSHRDFDNTPDDTVLANLAGTAARMEDVRSLLGHSIHINSGYRSPQVNAAVGGAKTSAHLTGHACDFICPDFGTPLAVCRKLQASGLKFDQVIQEGTWTHISFDPRMRGQILTKAANGGYTVGLST